MIKHIFQIMLLCVPCMVWAQEGSEVTVGEKSVEPSGEMLSADEYRQRVLDYSLTLKQSSAELESVTNAMREAKTSFLPSLDFGASGQYRVTDYDMDMMGTKVSMKPESYSLEADVRQVIYGGGAVKHGYKAAQMQQEIAQKSEELTRTNVAYSAEVNYWMAAAKFALWELTERYVKLIEEQTQVIRERFNDGLISKTDLLQIEGHLSSARIQSSEARKSYQLALQNLNILMGCTPTAPVNMSEQVSRADEIPASIMSLDEVLDRRLEYGISQKQLDFQTAQMKIYRSKYLPKLVVGMKAGWGTTMLNFDGSTMWNSYAYASLSIPIFRWGAKYKGVASQRALMRRTEYAMQDTRDRISKELYAAYTNLVEYSHQITVAQDACETTRESLDLNTFSYNEGKLPIVDVLSAQVAWVQSNSSLIKAWLQEKIAYADYKKAIGENVVTE